MANHASIDPTRSGPISMPIQPSEAAMRRIPSGGRSRDRASLRQRQRRDMEAKASKQNPKTSHPSSGMSNHNGYVNTGQLDNQDDYGFSGEQKGLNNGKANGYADMSGNMKPENDDKWYMKDSMRPVGASAHGHMCKCYRCQRKLTAI